MSHRFWLHMAWDEWFTLPSMPASQPSWPSVLLDTDETRNIYDVRAKRPVCGINPASKLLVDIRIGRPQKDADTH